MKNTGYLLFTTLLIACGGNRQEMQPVAGPDSLTAKKTLTVTDTLRPEFNSLLNAYFSLKDALVEADSLQAGTLALELQQWADSVDLSTFSVDSSSGEENPGILLGNLAAEAKGLAGENTLTEKRRSFSMISRQLLPLLKQVSYDGSTVYQQTCPMAFNDSESASWLSREREIMNPYLGKKHPKYAAGMLHCGELGDSIVARPR